MKKKNRLLQTIIFSTLTLTCFSGESKIVYPDFLSSLMRLDLGLERADRSVYYVNQYYIETCDQETLNTFKTIYEKNLSQIDPSENVLKIPKIIHQIWLGGSVPQQYIDWMKSWESLDGWEYKLWTDKEVENLNLVNQKIYDESINLGQKSDILRLELLAQFGGLYVDTDFECINAEIIEELHKHFDFYICTPPLSHQLDPLPKEVAPLYRFNNAIIASSADNPLIHKMVNELNDHFTKYEETYPTPVVLTGPCYVSLSIFDYEKKKMDNKKNMYLPSSFFYPITPQEALFFAQHPRRPIYVYPETGGIHYWNVSWTNHPLVFSKRNPTESRSYEIKYTSINTMNESN